MSGEAFQTVLSCDMRTAPDGRGVEYAPSGTGQPRWLTDDGYIRREPGVRGWADCYLYAEHAILLSAKAVREEAMDGETGDHPEKRERAARILEAAANAVRLLALDAAHDSYLTDERWQAALDHITATITETINETPGAVDAQP